MAGAGICHSANRGHRIGDQFVHGNRFIGDAVDEGGVRAVLQQAPDEIGEQRLMCADRRIDAAWPVKLAGTDDLFVEGLAHSMQALELVFADLEIRPRQVVDRGERLRVMGGKLREDELGRAEQLSCAGDVGDVRVDLAGENREIVQPVELGTLDLRIPVGALHQPHHDAMPGAAREVDDVVEHEGAALAIALDDEADAIPAGKIRIETQFLEQVERKLQSVRLLSIDVEADVIAFGEKRQCLHPWKKFRHDAGRLRTRISGMQRRQLDGDTRPLVNAAPVGSLADRVDRRFVVAEIALGIRRRRGGFPQHVIGIAEPLFLHLP